MAALRSGSAGRAARALCLVFGLGCLPSSGCVTLPAVGHRAEAAPGVPVTQVVATWEPRVVVAADVVNGGRQLPGLAGRVYLFGVDDGFPVVGDGAVKVELYDRGPDAPPLEVWQITPDKLKMFLREDPIGWGYTLFLPWSTYSPEITNVSLRVVYLPKSGTPIYGPDSTLHLIPGGYQPPVVRRTVQIPAQQQTAGNQPPAAPGSPQELPMPRPVQPGQTFRPQEVPLPQQGQPGQTPWPQQLPMPQQLPPGQPGPVWPPAGAQGGALTPAAPGQSVPYGLTPSPVPPSAVTPGQLPPSQVMRIPRG